MDHSFLNRVCCLAFAALVCLCWLADALRPKPPKDKP